MDTLPEEQLKQGMLASGIAHQGSDSHLRRQIDQRCAGESPFTQRKESNKLFVSSWTRLLGVAFTSLAAAYFLLLCFRFIESARQWSPPTRFLADRRGESCYSGSVSGDGDEGGSWPTGDSAGLVLEDFGDGIHLLNHEASGSQVAAGGTREVDAEAASYLDISEDAAGFNPTHTEDAGLHLWEGRNMPADQEERLKNLFGRMKDTLNLCGPLLPVLTYMQRMQVVFYVARLVGLDLGAASLVKENMEPERRAVGDSAIQLIDHLLQLVNNDTSNRKFRRKVEKLKILLEQIKQPRHIREEKRAQKYRMKMIALMSTAEVALKCCAGVLQGLGQLKEDPSKRLPPKVVAQQVDVLKAIFDAHVDHLSKDGCLRQHILDCQKNTGVGEPSQRLQPPAPFQGGYSLFGGGGIPPWLPFSQASPASIESRSTARGGMPREGGGAQRRSVSGDGDEGGSGPTGDSADGLELESFGEGSPLLHHEAFGLQSTAGGTQEEVVAAGLQGAAGGKEAEAEEAEADFMEAFYDAWSPPTRSLAARRDESCDSGSVSGDGDEGGSGPTGDSADGLELESFGEGSPLLHHEAFGLQSTAGGTQEEVVAAGLQGAAGGKEAEAEEAEADFMEAFYDAVREYVGGVAPDSEKSHETCDLHLWESRNIPAEEEHCLIRLFRRMQEAASSCRSLLPVLTRRHRLQLTNHVLKLLALDLGAIYLVKEGKERRRSAVGDSLIKLAKHALYHGHDGAGSKKLRSRLITLTTLITELKQPRHLYKEKAPEKYKRKMIAILATAEVALKNCLGVLNGLLQLREDTSAAQLPPRTAEQQIEVVKS
ncbi:hypothetical protein ENH_00023750, partial [Eimeria necatrix]